MPLIIPNIVDRPAFIPEFDDWNSFSGKQVAISGASGTLGNILCGALERNGISYQSFLGDITVSADVNDWISEVRPDVFFHLAAIVPTNEVLADPSRAMKTNAISMLHIMDGLKKFARNCWFFYASTSHVYRETVEAGGSEALSEDSPITPISLYGATKFAGESICRPMAEAYGISICIGRIFSFYHSSQPESFLIPSLCSRIGASSPNTSLEIHNLAAVRDFLDAETVVDAILWLYARHATGTVNIASGKGTTVMAMAEKIAEGLNKKIRFLKSGSNTPTKLVANTERLARIINCKNE